MIQSMTAFASRTGAYDSASWAWEIRGVNGRGLDLRLRLPEGIEGLEAALRAALTKALSRGNVTLSLRLNREETASGLQVDQAQLDRVLGALDLVQHRAFELGVTLAQANPADVLAQRGVILSGRVDKDTAPLLEALLADFEPLMADFMAMRAAEGQALKSVLMDQIGQIESLTAAAATAAAARREDADVAFRAAIRRVLDAAPDLDPARIAQEVAVLAVKNDVQEEIDRLGAHIAAARTLLKDKAPAGRKLDFLAQEFNREANTLCSKAQSTALTAIGLDLKAVIDQMREQIQNVE